MSDTLRIVVGVDFTEPGDHALDEALRYAKRMRLDELHAVYVLPEGRKREIPTVSRRLEDGREALRQRVIERCEAQGSFDQEVVLHVRLGEPATALHQVAVDVDADLIIVGTHGRRGLSKMFLGSVAEELVRTARVPVTVARPKQLDDLPKTDRPDAPREDEDMHESRVRTRSFGRRSSHISGLV